MNDLISKKNRLMHLITGLVVLLAFIVNILGRYFHLFDHSHGLDHMVSAVHIEKNFSFALNILVMIPLLLLTGSYLLYRSNKSHVWIPYLLTSALTFGSIAIISGGSGRVEFHFSIFMVVAALGYYQNIKLISLMTSIFAVQHLIGFLYFPEIIFGVSSYSLLMLLLHATFLVLTSSAVSWQVYSSKRIEMDLLRERNEQRTLIIEEIVDRISLTSAQIVDVSHSLSERSETTANASSQLARSIAQVASGIETQRRTLDKNVAFITEVTSGIQGINQTALIASDEAHQSAQQANDGKQMIGHLLEQINDINGFVDDSYTNMESLHNSTQSIENMIDVISSISEQTNLLALNASIEAARAGEYGKGFSVVANEVRKLAERSSESTQLISKLIKLNLENTRKSVDSITKVKQSTKAGFNLIHNSNAVFTQIYDSSQTVAVQITEISALAEELKGSSEQINSAMLEMTKVTDQSVESTTRVKHTTEIQHQLTEETFKVVSELSKLTSELDAVINKLKE